MDSSGPYRTADRPPQLRARRSWRWWAARVWLVLLLSVLCTGVAWAAVTSASARVVLASCAVPVSISVVAGLTVWAVLEICGWNRS